MGFEWGEKTVGKPCGWIRRRKQIASGEKGDGQSQMNASSSILDIKLQSLYARTGGHTIKFGLGTTRRLLEALGVDPLGLACVHVAGTNGKGSVSAMVESVLRAMGLKTGLYTSPHLIRFNERMRIGGEAIGDAALNQLLDEVERADSVQAEKPGEDVRRGTFFELTTAAAMKWFQDEGVHAAVMETGLGGRLDSTNVVRPLVSVITKIGLEHTAQLGTTLEAIAGEKAGIIKPGRPVVSARQRPAAEAVLRAKAEEAGSPFLKAEEHVSIRRLASKGPGQLLQIETGDGTWEPVRLPLEGDYQLENCAAAICALEWLREREGFPLTEEVMRRGLESVKWAGRCQMVSEDPPILVDVAHNPDGAEALAKYLKRAKRGRKIALVCGMLGDKDARSFFRTMQPVVDACVLVPLDSERSMTPEELMAAAEDAKLPAVPGTLPEALHRATAWATKNGGMVVAAGSLILAAAVLNELGVEV